MNVVEISIYNFLGSKINNNTLLFGLVCILPSLMGHTPLPPMGGTGLLLMFAAKMVAVVLMWDLELTLRDGLILLGLYPIARAQRFGSIYDVIALISIRSRALSK